MMSRSGGGRSSNRYGGRGYYAPVRGSDNHPLAGMDSGNTRSARTTRRRAESINRRNKRRSRGTAGDEPPGNPPLSEDEPPPPDG